MVSLLSLAVTGIWKLFNRRIDALKAWRWVFLFCAIGSLIAGAIIVTQQLSEDVDGSDQDERGCDCNKHPKVAAGLPVAQCGAMVAFEHAEGLFRSCPTPIGAPSEDHWNGIRVSAGQDIRAYSRALNNPGISFIG